MKRKFFMCLLTVGVLFVVFSQLQFPSPKKVTVAIQPPIGTIVAYAGKTDTIPDGWMLCDGRDLDSRNKKYSKLFETIGTVWGGDGASLFYLPDLRGRFLRGVDNGVGRDPEARKRENPRSDLVAKGNTGDNVGSVQDDMYFKHNHDTTHFHTLGLTNVREGSNTPVCWVGGNIPPSPRQMPTDTRAGTNNGGACSSNGGEETRPKNANVNWIIRVY